jgi:hypothetical protein
VFLLSLVRDLSWDLIRGSPKVIVPAREYTMAPALGQVAIRQLTNHELLEQLGAAQQLLKFTDPDLLQPQLRDLLGRLFGQLDQERIRRKDEHDNVTPLYPHGSEQ